MIWYVFPIKDGVSWEGHLGGLITGFVFAVIFRKAIAKPDRYVWQEPEYNEEDDSFLRHFDADGNFIENLEPEIEVELENEVEDEIEIEDEIEDEIEIKAEDTTETSIDDRLNINPSNINYIYKETPKS